ncbi:uncharacterized protein LOC134778043 [Penaeus indicus]|uniref:uncharacterized protein LOC134778043 n=1 Tax=Penaeus indicus TaxID=29960 RepID=UPI00300C6A56
MIFAARQIQEKCREKQQPFYELFVDLTKAFDTVSRSLWLLLRKYGCPTGFIELVRQLHDGMEARIISGSDTSEPFSVSHGVKQGCVITLTLFAHSEADFQQSLDQLHTACQRFGLKISVKKTVAMFQPAPVGLNDTIDGQLLQVVDKFAYLGSCISSDGTMDAEIDCQNQGVTGYGSVDTSVWIKRLIGRRGVSHYIKAPDASTNLEQSGGKPREQGLKRWLNYHLAGQPTRGRRVSEKLDTATLEPEAQRR